MFIKRDKSALQKVYQTPWKALYKTWLYLETKIKEEIKDEAYDTGDFLRSVNTRKVRENEVRVGSNHIQAWIMEYWRKPGKFPNLDALVWWAWRHWFHKDSRTKPYDSLSNEAKGKVYVLARGIARKWIKPRRIFRDTFERLKKDLNKKYQKFLKDYLK